MEQHGFTPEEIDEAQAAKEDYEAEAYFERNYAPCDVCKEWVLEKDLADLLGEEVCPECFQMIHEDLNEEFDDYDTTP